MEIYTMLMDGKTQYQKTYHNVQTNLYIKLKPIKCQKVFMEFNNLLLKYDGGRETNMAKGSKNTAEELQGGRNL